MQLDIIDYNNQLIYKCILLIKTSPSVNTVKAMGIVCQEENTYQKSLVAGNHYDHQV